MVALIDIYNQEYAIPKNKPEIARAAGREDGSSLLEIPCTVEIVGNSTYGKIPIGMLEDTVIMEYKHLFT